MVRPARWTHSPRPTQESSSTLRPRCPPCTARACCSNKAPRAARRKVSTRPSQDKQCLAKREPCLGSISSQRLSEGPRVASSLMFTFSPALIGVLHFFNLYCKSFFYDLSFQPYLPDRSLWYKSIIVQKSTSNKTHPVMGDHLSHSLMVSIFHDDGVNLIRFKFLSQ